LPTLPFFDGLRTGLVTLAVDAAFFELDFAGGEASAARRTGGLTTFDFAGIDFFEAEDFALWLSISATLLLTEVFDALVALETGFVMGCFLRSDRYSVPAFGFSFQERNHSTRILREAVGKSFRARDHARDGLAVSHTLRRIRICATEMRI
jgi:hypothetical protein